MKYLFLILLDAMVIGFYLYTILLPNKEELDEKHRKWFDMADSLFSGLTKMTGNLAKPYKVGANLNLDLGPVILMAILVFVNILFFLR